jgi:hypothetical protein
MKEFATAVKNVTLKNPIDFNHLESQDLSSSKPFSKNMFLGSSVFWSLLTGNKSIFSSSEEHNDISDIVDIESYMYKTMF